VSYFGPVRGSDNLWRFCYASEALGCHPQGFCAKADHDGHRTQREAELCYHAWMVTRIDLARRWDPPRSLPCAVCEVETDRYASLRAYYVPLCDAHRTRAIAANYFERYSRRWKTC
jgi:hypothetical protein